jgi:hypothetical protein
MPNWNEILKEVNELVASGRGDAIDVIRRKYLKSLSDITGRNTIAYYSGFMNNASIEETSISDADKNGFMTVINKLDRGKGLDLLLHTPGGDLAATESLVEYLRSMFGNNIRAIIPQIAMSAGSMIACSCSSIVMGKQSSIGPIDPQMRGIPASGVIEEFKRAKDEIADDPKCIPLWQVIIGKYHPTFIGECEKAIEWSKEIVTKWLKSNMLKDDANCDAIASDIVDYLSDHSEMKAHARHVGIDDCEKIGLKIERLEMLNKANDFQDAVLSVHHSYMIMFSLSSVIKAIENQNGAAMLVHKHMDTPIAQKQLMPIQLPVQFPFQTPPQNE